MYDLQAGFFKLKFSKSFSILRNRQKKSQNFRVQLSNTLHKIFLENTGYVTPTSDFTLRFIKIYNSRNIVLVFSWNEVSTELPYFMMTSRFVYVVERIAKSNRKFDKICS